MTVSYWIILLATIASFLFGALWYGAFSRQWQAALGKTSEELQASAGFAVPLIVTFVAQLVMAWVLAGLLTHMLKGGVPATMRNGMLSAGLIWLGFVASTLASNHSFQGIKRQLTAIDSGHWLGVLLIQGAILGGWGMR
jgi:Protein of unknown function (DUF1761)